MAYLEGICLNLLNEDYEPDSEKPLEPTDINIEEYEKEFNTKDIKLNLKEVGNLLHKYLFLSKINDELTENPDKYVDTIKLYQRKERLRSKAIYSI